MSGPSISEQREAVAKEANRNDKLMAPGTLHPDIAIPLAKHIVALRAAAETLAVVEWMQRLNPAAWAREVTLYKRAQAELAAMDKQEGRGDG